MIKYPQTKINQPSSSVDVSMRDWRKALRAAPSYRIINRTFRFHYHFALVITMLAMLVVIFFYIRPDSISTYSDNNWLGSNGYQRWSQKSYRTQPTEPAVYNSTYPLSEPITSDSGIITYRIGLIADMDKNSKDTKRKHLWHSFYRKGYLSYNQLAGNVVVTFDTNKPIRLTDGYAFMGRGMELSELVTFNGRLLTFDDRTGLIYEILNDNVIPWLLLIDGNGQVTKGFKSEWATVKDHHLYVGSIGKEWTSSSGDFENNDPMYVKIINVNGVIHHMNWIENYKALRAVIGISWPGYMIHESAVWSSIHRKWFFLPRRCSKEKYNETKDEYMGCNVLITANEDFTNIKAIKLVNSNPSHGFSSFKFVPGTGDSIIVALQTEEVNGFTSTFITAFTSDTGQTILSQQRVPEDYKYEGFEFI